MFILYAHISLESRQKNMFVRGCAYKHSYFAFFFLA